MTDHCVHLDGAREHARPPPNTSRKTPTNATAQLHATLPPLISTNQAGTERQDFNWSLTWAFTPPESPARSSGAYTSPATHAFHPTHVSESGTPTFFYGGAWRRRRWRSEGGRGWGGGPGGDEESSPPPPLLLLLVPKFSELRYCSEHHESDRDSSDQRRVSEGGKYATPPPAPPLLLPLTLPAPPLLLWEPNINGNELPVLPRLLSPFASGASMSEGNELPSDDPPDDGDFWAAATAEGPLSGAEAEAEYVSSRGYAGGRAPGLELVAFADASRGSPRLGSEREGGSDWEVALERSVRA